MPSKGRLRCSCILIFLPILFPVPIYAVQINASPLFFCESRDDEHIHGLIGPIIEFSSHANAIRPFYYEDKDTSEKDILYPLGHISGEGSRFIPLYFSVDQDDNRHTDLFPVFYGRYKETPYWGVFPFYGTMEHRFGFTRARFILLPLYAETSSDETTTYSFLWPVFTYSKDRLYRVFPLYGWENKSGATYQFFLWPFVHHATGPDRNKMDAVLPLFRYDRGPTHESISILWPFFTYNRDESARHMSVDFPWPLIRIASGAYEETRVFPLYWAKTEGNAYSMKTVLWPLWSRTKRHYDDTGKDQDTIAILVVNRLTKETSQKDQISERVILWPLLYSSRTGEKRQWHFPAVFPLFFNKGFASTWGPVLSLAQGTSDGSSSETSILWGTLSWGRSQETSWWSIPILASLTRTPAYREWGFLGNLLTFRSVLDEDAHVKGE